MIMTYFSTLSGVSALNVLISEFIIRTLKIENGLAKQIISWVLPVILCVLGFVFGYGFFTEFGTIDSVLGWVYTVVTGIGIGLVSNGVYEIKGVRTFLETLAVIFNSFKLNKK